VPDRLRAVAAHLSIPYSLAILSRVSISVVTTAPFPRFPPIAGEKMTVPHRLHEGYRRFRERRYDEERALFETLSKGQRPQTAIIACADSRVDPTVIFSASPGELFVVRNVANLVPPCEDDSKYHGTSAALEFAVGFLKVRDLIVMGHQFCGGIAACLSAHHDRPVGRFIAPWVEIAASARDEVVALHPGASDGEAERLLEEASIRHSIARLHEFPFVAEAVANGTLAVHGAWFSIAAGELSWLDPESGEFRTVDAG
jgi:carbonic anhydrase